MNARTRGRLVGAALIGLPVVLAVMALWFFGGYERVERRERLPPSGEAASDPLYALRKALEADGITVEARDTLEPPRFVGRHRDTVLLHGDPSVVADAEARALMAWVERGGHLVLRTPRRGDLAEMPLLAALGVQALKPQACEPLHLQGEPPHQEFCGGRRFVLADGQAPQLQWGDPETGLGHARWQRGKGTVDLIAQLDFVTTRGLRDVPHQALARQLLAPNYGRGTVHLVRGGSPLPPFLHLLAWSWPVWLPLVLLLMAGLWRHGQRFGPWQPTPAQGRRSLLEHVRASGELLFRGGHLEPLHAAMREAFLARLRRRDPATYALHDAARVAALSERLQMPLARVREAMQPPQDRQEFHARVRTLVQMRNRL